ncbi:MAG: signal peptidase I [Peptococcales bacterium]|jgi:signal peptidase I
MEKIKKIFKEVGIIIVTAFCLSLFLQSFIFEARSIPTGSMLPTIQIDQRILVNKFVYKFKEPQRGDIIVFNPPVDINDGKEYIKRVIGLPGDKIEIKNGYVFVNEEKLLEDYIYEKAEYEFGPIWVPEKSLFVLGDNRNDSYDSHAWTKWLTLDNVKGKAFFTYWPYERLGLFNTEVLSANTNNK